MEKKEVESLSVREIKSKLGAIEESFAIVLNDEEGYIWIVEKEISEGIIEGKMVNEDILDYLGVWDCERESDITVGVKLFNNEVKYIN